MPTAARLSRREFLKGVALTASAGLVAACAPPTGAPGAPAAAPTAGAAAQPATQEKVTLQMWAFATNRVKWEEAMIPTFEEQNPGYTVKITTFPYADMHDKLLTALQAGTGAPDIGDVARQEHTRYLKERDTLLPLDDRLGAEKENLFLGSAVAEWTYKGKIYGIGNELNACLMFYRFDLFAEAGIEDQPIDTWEEFLEKGKLYTEKTGKFFTACPDQDNAYYTILSQYGGGWFDKDGNCNVNNPFAVRILQMLHDWVYVDKIAELMPGGNYYNSAWYGALSAGDYAVVFGAPWYQGFMKDNAPGVAGKWHMGPLPIYQDGTGARSATFGGTGMTITEQSKYPDQCWEFIRLCNLTVEGQMKGFELQNLYPTYRPAWEDERLFRPDPYFDNQKPGDFLKAIAGEMPLPSTSPYWTFVNDALTRLAIAPVMADTATAQEALDAVCAEMAKEQQA